MLCWGLPSRQIQMIMDRKKKWIICSPPQSRKLRQVSHWPRATGLQGWRPEWMGYAQHLKLLGIKTVLKTLLNFSSIDTHWEESVSTFCFITVEFGGKWGKWKQVLSIFLNTPRHLLNHREHYKAYIIWLQNPYYFIRRYIRLVNLYRKYMSTYCVPCIDKN